MILFFWYRVLSLWTRFLFIFSEYVVDSHLEHQGKVEEGISITTTIVRLHGTPQHRMFRSSFLLPAALAIAVHLAGSGRAFVPPSISSHGSNICGFPGRSSFGQRPLSRTTLSMGVMEDFLSGRDASAREEANKKYLASLQERVDRINSLESSIEELGDDELEAKSTEFRERLAKGEDINGPLLEEAFAVVREAAW